jgi:hypothetical protein
MGNFGKLEIGVMDPATRPDRENNQTEVGRYGKRFFNDEIGFS